MGWTKVEVPKPHKCDTPYYEQLNLRPWDVIRCDECGQHWRLEYIDCGMQHDPYTVGVNHWNRVTLR